MANKIVSFDFDGCLHRSVIQGHPIGRENYNKWIPFKEIIQKVYDELRHHEVVIVTARDSYEIPFIQKFLKLHKIPITKIFCTDDEPKLETLQQLKAVRHYDDSLNVKKELENSNIEFIQTYP